MHVQTNSRLDAVNGRIDGVNGRIDGLTRDVADVRERIEAIESEVRGFPTAFRTHWENWWTSSNSSSGRTR